MFKKSEICWIMTIKKAEMERRKMWVKTNRVLLKLKGV